MSKSEYAVYRGEEFITIGTAKECADETGVSAKSIRWLSTPTAKKRQANRKVKNGLVVLRLEH